MKKWLLLSVLMLAGCQHGGVIIKETPAGLSEIRRVTASVFGEPRSTSPNGYELVTKFFDRKDRIIERPAEVRERYYAVVGILGDRRPYDVRVQVYVEVRTPDGYEGAGQDDLLAEHWADKVKEALHQSRDKRNVIDDFKAF